ncbi:Amidase domain-containing protein [Hyphomicrobiales bacterium]|nr:Amidase domain-containing protein [Hyphomicrobiales bacterium]CAH1692326.1 Amidase domain-containing protein [Hyphomicrobiales bacterium]
MASAAGSIRMRDRAIGYVQASASAEALLCGYRKRFLSPVEVTEAALARIDSLDGELGAMVVVLKDLAREQGREAELAWKSGGNARPLEGVPVTIKDTFDLAGSVSTRGSRVFARSLAYEDSGVVRRLRAAGAILIGKTNTAEFGQSATSENCLGMVTRNPWQTALTPGGSSGGAAVSVAAGYVPLALGADGGGSIRIPAAMTGTFGFKPTYGLCPDEGGFRGMSDFCCPGPFANSVADARLFLSVLAERDFAGRAVAKDKRIGFCLRPDGRPVDHGIQAAVLETARCLTDLGHAVEELRLDLDGWNDAFGPLVLREEWQERGHFLDYCAGELTDYEYASLQAARDLTTDKIKRARRQHLAYRARIATLFERYDALLLPTTASPAFPIDTRPQEIAGEPVGRLWGAFPFTSAFNVGGNPAAALPAGLSNGLPVSAQLVGACGQDAALLDLAEDLEGALAFSARYRKVAA